MIQDRNQTAATASLLNRRSSTCWEAFRLKAWVTVLSSVPVVDALPAIALDSQHFVDARGVPAVACLFIGYRCSSPLVSDQRQLFRIVNPSHDFGCLPSPARAAEEEAFKSFSFDA